jgi:hypothetical protein
MTCKLITVWHVIFCNEHRRVILFLSSLYNRETLHLIEESVFMRKMKLWLNSLRFKLFSGLLFTIVPLIIVLLIINHYSAQVVRNQVAQSNKNMLSLYMGQIDRNLQEVDNFLINLSQTNLDLLDLDTDRITNESIRSLYIPA